MLVLLFDVAALLALTWAMIPSLGAGQTARGDDEMASDPASNLALILPLVL